MLKKTAFIMAIMMVVGLAAVSDSSAADFKWPDFMKIGTPRVGTANHSIASAWSAEFSADTGVKARVLPVPNSYGRAEWLQNNEIDIALFQASEYIEHIDAIEGYCSDKAGPAKSRVIYLSLITPWGFMVRGDSYIKTYNDISPDTKVVWYPGSSFIMTGIRALLAMKGLTPEEVKLVEVGSYGANSKVIPEGRADVTFTSPLSDLNYEVAANPKGIRWLEIPSAKEDAKANQAYRALQAGYSIVPVKSGHQSAHGIRMAQAYQTYHVRADTDPELVYQLVKWLDENHAKYKDKYTHAKLMSMDSVVEFLETDPVEPLHPGMIRYLKEKGVWKEKYAKQNEFNTKLSDQYVDAFRTAVAEAQKKGLKTVPDNKEWVSFWKQYRKDHGLGESYGSPMRP